MVDQQLPLGVLGAKRPFRPQARLLLHVHRAKLELTAPMALTLYTLISQAALAGIEITTHETNYGDTRSRNAALDLAREQDLDGVLLLNHAVVPHVDAVADLLALYVPLSSALYYSRVPPHHPEAYFHSHTEGGIEVYRSIEEIPDRPFPVDTVGAGCLLIRKAFWQQHPDLRFRHLYHEGGDSGEPLDFGRQATARGIRPIVHPGIPCHTLAFRTLDTRNTVPGKVTDQMIVCSNLRSIAGVPV